MVPAASPESDAAKSESVVKEAVALGLERVGESREDAAGLPDESSIASLESWQTPALSPVTATAPSAPAQQASPVQIPHPAPPKPAVPTTKSHISTPHFTHR